MIVLTIHAKRGSLAIKTEARDMRTKWKLYRIAYRSAGKTNEVSNLALSDSYRCFIEKSHTELVNNIPPKIAMFIL